jgi:hypothetical protein
MYGMVTEIDVKKVTKLVIVSVVPPLGLLLGAVIADGLIDGILNAATQQEAFGKLVALYYTWALIPTPQVAVAYFAIRDAKRNGICGSASARRIAPWILGAGFVASLLTIPLYGRLLSLLGDGWREATEFTYFMPIILTYGAMFSQLDCN